MMESTCLYSYRFGRFKLQPGERRLLAAGVPVPMEPRAFDVLVALAERAGHLVTKEELFSLVWSNLIVEENNLQVQVSALRKILGHDAIATVPGQGYRFVLEATREVSDSAPSGTAAQNDRSARAGITSPVQAFRQAFAPASNAREEVARHPLAHLRRWQWIAGGVAIVLIGAAAWLYQVPKTTLPTTAIAELPPLSIAILPFAAATDEQLAATLMPELTAAFWRNARSATIASPALVAQYEGKHVDARAVGHELNVRYVVESEIRRAGDTRRLTARLVDAANGAQIWTERFEVLEDLPEPYAWLAPRVAMHIWVALYRAERDREVRSPPPNLTATDIWLRGAAVDDEPLEGALTARKFFEKALELDPRHVGAMRSLGVTYQTELDLSPHADGDRLRRELDELSLRAVATDRTDLHAWELRAMSLGYNNRFEEALDAATELERIEPNHVLVHVRRAIALVQLGRTGEALEQVDQGLMMDPTGPYVGFLMGQKCKDLVMLGAYEKAIPICEKSATDHQYITSHVYLTAAYAQLGEMDKAAAAKARLLKLAPGFTIARLAFALPPNATRNPAWLQQAETNVKPGLRKAGIPEQP